jgi:hypothetical protein
MKMTLQVVIEDEDHMPPIVKEVFSLERKNGDLRSETLGLKLNEAKEILAEVQTMLVTAQAARFQQQQSSCPDCERPYPRNGTHQLTFRTLFGTMKLLSQTLLHLLMSPGKSAAVGTKTAQYESARRASCGANDTRVYLSADQVGCRHEL